MFSVRTIFIFLIGGSSLSAKQKFEERKLEDCVAHSLQVISPLVFPLPTNGTFFILNIRGFHILQLTIMSTETMSSIVTKRFNAQELCISCKGQCKTGFRFAIRKEFSLVFHNTSLYIRNGLDKNFTSVCEDLAVPFPEKFEVSFKLIDPTMETFTGHFAFNCSQGCWQYSSLSLNLPTRSPIELTLFYKSKVVVENGTTASLMGLADAVVLQPEKRWKNLTMRIEEQRISDDTILSVREGGSLVVTTVPESPELQLWTESSSGVTWTQECIPPQEKSEKEEKEKEKEKMNEEIRNETLSNIVQNDDASFLGTGFSKETFVQILLFAGCLLITGFCAVTCSVFVIRSRESRPSTAAPLRHLETELKTPKCSESNENEYESMSLSREFVCRNQVPVSPPPPLPRFPPIIPDEPPLPDSQDDPNGYMEMGQNIRSHLMSDQTMDNEYKEYNRDNRDNRDDRDDKDTTNDSPINKVYNSLGSLIDEDKVYETLRKIETNRQSTTNGHQVETSLGETLEHS